MRIKRILILLLLLPILISCDNKALYKKSGEALGTTYNVHYYASESSLFKPKFDSIFNAINNSISTYVPTSDVSKLNKGEDVELDQHFQTVFKSSKYLHHITDGYFDPSIGVLVNAYGFGPENYALGLSKEKIDSLMALVGFDKFILNGNEINTNLDKFYLDFNANGKGYAVDVLANYLEQNNISDYFVEIGGEIVASGYDINEQKSWRFGIEKPVQDNFQRDLSFAIAINNKALATSGNYRKYRIDSLTGLKYVHTINPKTGLAQRSNVLSASVLADDCITADGLATAFMAMGFEKAKLIIENNKLSALLIYADESNQTQTYMTKDIEDIIYEY